MKIFDCFMFYNELDLLKIRLNELDPIVDKFVLVEATRSHQNKPKQLYFEQNIEKFSKFLHKIIHVIVQENQFSNNDSMYNDRMQRANIQHGLKDATDDDLILISDLDEIPSVESIEQALKNNSRPLVFEQLLHYYYLNTQLMINGSPYNYGTVAMTKSQFLSNTELARSHQKHYFEKIKNGGWHFSFLGDKNKVFNKLQNYAHSEFKNLSESEIANRFFELKDPLGRINHDFRKMDNLEYLPNYIKNNIEDFKQYIK